MARNTRSYRFWVPWCIGLLLWTLTMLLAARYDLALSSSVADRKSALGQLVDFLGELPSWILVAISLVLLVVVRKPGSRLEPCRPLVISVLLQTLLFPATVSWWIKLLWGRVRFWDLAPDRSNFTPFYLPAGMYTGTSFPSGHVAMAMVWAPIPYFLLVRGNRAGALLALCLGLLYGLAVAWGRIVYGMHYLTDVTFSLGFSLLLAPLLVRWRIRKA